MRLSLGMASMALAIMGASIASQAAEQTISIGTGGVTGVYFPTGGAICRLVNKDRQTHGIRCATESTGGSIENINTVRSGDLTFGVAQSDAQYFAVNGIAPFAGQGGFENLRAVFSIYPEPFTLMVRKGSEISGFQALKGKKVNVGNLGSGQRATMELVMRAFGLAPDDFALAADLNSAEMIPAICNGRIDATAFIVGHPAAAITEAVSHCEIDLVDVKGPAIEQLLKTHDFYRPATIPGGLYKGIDQDVTTFRVGATMITSADVADEVVYAVVKAVFDHFELFKSLHPALARLKESEMIADGLSAPLHPGARRYYEERGWIR